MIELSPMGPGFLIFFQEEVVSGSGARPLEYYEHEIREALDRKEDELLKEAAQARVRLIDLESERIKEEEIRQKQEIELKYLLVSKSLLKIEEDLTEVELKRGEIKRLARIMRDDDEVILILYG